MVEISTEQLFAMLGRLQAELMAIREEYAVMQLKVAQLEKPVEVPKPEGQKKDK